MQFAARVSQRDAQSLCTQVRDGNLYLQSSLHDHWNKRSIGGTDLPLMNGHAASYLQAFSESDIFSGSRLAQPVLSQVSKQLLKAGSRSPSLASTM